MKPHSYYSGDDEHREFTPKHLILAGIVLFASCFLSITAILFLIKWLGWWLFFAAIVIALLWSVYITFKPLKDEQPES